MDTRPTLGVRHHELQMIGMEWTAPCGCRYHPHDDNGTHGGAPHIHACTEHARERVGSTTGAGKRDPDRVLGQATSRGHDHPDGRYHGVPTRVRVALSVYRATMAHSLPLGFDPEDGESWRRAEGDTEAPAEDDLVRVLKAASKVLTRYLDGEG